MCSRAQMGAAILKQLRVRKQMLKWHEAKDEFGVSVSGKKAKATARSKKGNKMYTGPEGAS